MKNLSITVLLLFQQCVTYQPPSGFRIRGADIEIDCVYNYMVDGYSVGACFTPNIEIKSSKTKQDTVMEEEIYGETTLKLKPGNKTLLTIEGFDTVSYKYGYRYLRKTYNLLILINTLKTKDTLYLNSATINIVDFYHYSENIISKRYGVASDLIVRYEQSGTADELNGYLYFSTITADSIKGTLSFNGLSRGYFYDMTNDMLTTNFESKVKTTIRFTAARKKTNQITYNKILRPFRWHGGYREGREE